MMKHAVHLEPQNKQFQLSLAQIQFQMKDYAASKKTLEPLLAAEEDSAVKASAASMMTVIENHLQPAESSTRSTASAVRAAPGSGEATICGATACAMRLRM